jgi:Protein of unknown function (DUF2934)
MHPGAPARGQKPDPDESRIRWRAHQIWIEEGRPDGRALDHWLRARWELEPEPEPKAEVERFYGELDRDDTPTVGEV